MSTYYGRPYSQTSDNIHLKPVPYAESSSLHSRLSDDFYKPVAPSPYSNAELGNLEERDAKLKHRIRQVKLISRILAVSISAATVATLAMTLIKFFQTRHVYFTVDGVSRTAWASGTITWYTYQYFGVSTVSLILQSVILISYCRGVRQANSAASVAGYWSLIMIIGHVVVWIMSAAIFRYGKEPVDGKFVDLWGWTCSSAADNIQSQVPDINFSQYCTVQVSKSGRSLWIRIPITDTYNRLSHSTPES